MKNYRSYFKAVALARDPFTGKHPTVYGSYLQMREVNYLFFDNDPQADELEEKNVKHYIFMVRSGDWNMGNDIEKIEVDGKTVRQFTGVWDKQKHMVFEGDWFTINGYDYQVQWDTQKACFRLQLYIPEENRVTYIDFDATMISTLEARDHQ